MVTKKILLVDKIWKAKNIVNGIKILLKDRKITMDFYDAIEINHNLLSLDKYLESAINELEDKEND